MERKTTSRALWGLALGTAAVLAVKFFIADLYRVNSGSMVPTLHPAELVLVRYDRAPELERFDLAVLRRPGRDPAVKRVVGLPGETVRIVDGDLRVDGELLDSDTRRPEPIPVFDSRILPVGEHFHLRRGEDGPWRELEDRWRLEAEDVPPGASAGLMLLAELRDGYLGPDGTHVRGVHEVDDAVLECEVRPLSAAGRLSFLLVEEGDTFEARILLKAEQGQILELVRRSVHSLQESDAEQREAVLARLPVVLEPGRWTKVRFSNVDDHLRIALSDLPTEVSVRYEANEPYPGPAGAGNRSVGPRVGLGGAGCRAEFRAIRVLRDVHYTAGPGGAEYGTRAPVPLNAGEVFLLGDAANSHDSRAFGPVALGDLVGRPVAVVWPPARIRRLGR